ncbi:hypothetical protein QJS04_geneDACA011678 [Acorus gramineus]|uniref:Transmembrane protein n=1 Tax=Acorus gramineus TaxID=55184 RepID=A0AAV9BH37_ACOGR|nr:hypothetical protein QJS04_geneDACA011678 [Acorus gramineus]
MSNVWLAVGIPAGVVQRHQEVVDMWRVGRHHLCSSSGQACVRRLLRFIVLAVAWSIWRAWNALIFRGQQAYMENVHDEGASRVTDPSSAVPGMPWRFP